MLRTREKHKNDRGYILIVVVLMMLAMAVMASGMNRRAGMQARMSANQIRSSQIHLGQIAALEHAAWSLNLNPAWRGEPYVFDGITYNCDVQQVTLDGYTDAVTITVMAPGGMKEQANSFRIIPQKRLYYLIADTENHVIRSVDTTTGTIYTFAGNGSAGNAGDGGLATDAMLNNPKSVMADQAGNVYIADTMNHRIRKVDPNGTITPFAGNGSAGHSGDGGPATVASLNEPHGVAVDGLGNIYIADTKNHCIRKVDRVTGIITTVAGTPGVAGYKIDGGPAISAELNEPQTVYLDASGNLFIADTGNCMIRKVDGLTKKITRVAGSVSGGTPLCGYSGDMGPPDMAELDKPHAVYVDISGNIYIADGDNHRIRKVDVVQGIITTIAGNGVAAYGGDGGPAIDASLQNPKSVRVDENGNLLIADSENHRIRKVNGFPSGNIYTVAGDGTGSYAGDYGLAIDGSLKKPHGVCLYESPGPAYLFIADFYNYQIREVDLSKNFLVKEAGTLWYGYNGDNIPATSARLNYPFGVHLDARGNVYIADTYNHRIRKVNRSTGIITTVAGTGAKGFSGDGGPATSANLMYPFNLYLDTYGNIFILDTYNYRVRRVDRATGIITTVVGDGKKKFAGDGEPATSASIGLAFDLAVDADGNIYIADTNNQVIRKVDATTGIIDTVAGLGGEAGYSGDGGPATSARLNAPSGVCLDAAGNIYISDSNNSVVRKVDATSQIITTTAGKVTAGFSGDGGPATQAELQYPQGLWVDRGGNLFIADTLNCRVRRVDATTQIIDTVAGTTFCGYNGNNLMATDAALFLPSDLCIYEPTDLERLPKVYLPSS
jgi:streptogramin lyase